MTDTAEELQNTIPFLDNATAHRVRDAFGAPIFVYDEKTLRENAQQVLSFPNAYGMTGRYAMKACPNANILRLFDSMGLHFDASSGYEVERAALAGVDPAKISLSTQELPHDGVLKEYVEKGMSVNACSLYQLERYGELFPHSEVGLRFNPGLGSGGTQRTNVGGPASSFGIWKGDVEKAKEIVAKYDLKVFRIHSHIGSGSDPEVWLRAVKLTLDIVRNFPDVTTVNLGGGFKVGRMPDEVSTDLFEVGFPMRYEFEMFSRPSSDGRELHLEVEPGTYLVANACALLASVQDTTSTGDDGYRFLKLDTGMTELTRPSMYGSQHPIEVYPTDESERGLEDYIVVGHCCESGDILTPAPADPEALSPRNLTEAKVGDLIALGGCGAYCSSMSTKNYNSFPEAPEVMIREDGTLNLMRKRQKLEQIVVNEVKIDF